LTYWPIGDCVASLVTEGGVERSGSVYARSGARSEGLAGGAGADGSFAINKIVRSRVIAGETPCAGLRVAERAAERESLAGDHTSYCHGGEASRSRGFDT
jgi:hypothetical protein